MRRVPRILGSVFLALMALGAVAAHAVDGVLEIGAHYVIRTNDGALVEVRSDGLRHGPPEVMVRLAAGEPVARDAYFFRTLMRFTTGDARWLHLNKVMAIASGERQARLVVLDVWRLA